MYTLRWYDGIKYLEVSGTLLSIVELFTMMRGLAKVDKDFGLESVARLGYNTSYIIDPAGNEYSGDDFIEILKRDSYE